MEIDDKLRSKAVSSLSAASKYAFNLMKPDGHWIGEFLSNVTITAEHIFLRQTLGVDLSASRDAFQRFILSQQKQDGSWSIAPKYPSDVSTGLEAYLALKILGVPESAPQMLQAKKWILQNGGAAKMRIFTRIFFAMFGLVPWDAVPQVPAEFILLPKQSPINIYTMASWARCLVVPLLIIRHHQPIYSLPNGAFADNDFLDELWIDPSNKLMPYGTPLAQSWGNDFFDFSFNLIDKAMWVLGGLRRSPLRGYSRRVAVKWILDHRSKDGDCAGFILPMHQNLQALVLEGYKVSDPVIQAGIAAIERFALEDEVGKRIQGILSPTWDTVFMIRALLDLGVSSTDNRIQKAVEWTKAHQILGPEGDWRVYKPELAPGGFAFEYSNNWYPDIDDTAVVILALLGQDTQAVNSPCIIAAAKWILGMQNSDGGWAAFDHNNDKLYLNRLPFSDMDALCDPSTADITGRVLETFGKMLELARGKHLPLALLESIAVACDRGIAYLAATQEQDGSWFGRWGINYLSGTSNVLCGLASFRTSHPIVETLIHPAISWLRTMQNPDGGFGEDAMTYKDRSHSTRSLENSTPTQTAWAIMGLLTVVGPDGECALRAVRWLVERQVESEGKGRSWEEEKYTAVGFPGHFYIGYKFYRHYFPMIALGRWVKALDGVRGKRDSGIFLGEDGN
ncbi:terpenoid cyclases/protein prenyltransferase alpha-alpha toroid [Halenospora varia]|nr:terpenoid cyclases/protein prenyltransferase alpha-alpha toroid [Halenospora varia]